MMQIAGLIAIGFVIGVVVTVLFGRKIAAATIAEAKAVAYDAARTVNEVSTRSRAAMAAIETRIHAKIDTLKTDVSSDVKKV